MVDSNLIKSLQNSIGTLALSEVSSHCAIVGEFMYSGSSLRRKYEQLSAVHGVAHTREQIVSYSNPCWWKNFLQQCDQLLYWLWNVGAA